MTIIPSWGDGGEGNLTPPFNSDLIISLLPPFFTFSHLDYLSQPVPPTIFSSADHLSIPFPAKHDIICSE